MVSHNDAQIGIGCASLPVGFFIGIPYREVDTWKRLIKLKRMKFRLILMNHTFDAQRVHKLLDLTLRRIHRRNPNDVPACGMEVSGEVLYAFLWGPVERFPAIRSALVRMRRLLDHACTPQFVGDTLDKTLLLN
ncbi:hypothetical protein D3C84_865070 [compost metagenome]